MMYDLLILGAGPAGITAAVYAARKKIDFLVITQDIGGQTAKSGDIENYTGYQFISGPELTLKFQEHMDSFGINVKMPEDVKGIFKENKLIRVVTNIAEYKAKCIIIATGKQPRPLNVPGENDFRNKGITYCATCDGPLFRAKDVAVVGGGNSALDAALQLMNIASRVYVINIGPELTGDRIMIDNLNRASNVEVYNNASVRRIYGDRFVEGVDLEHEGRKFSLGVEGVFVEIGLIPNTSFAGSLDLNEQKEIIVDCYNRTSVEGIFAAGDVTNVPEKQIVIAAGEGSKACLSAFRYLSSTRF